MDKDIEKNIEIDEEEIKIAAIRNRIKDRLIEDYYGNSGTYEIVEEDTETLTIPDLIETEPPFIKTENKK